MARTRFGPGIDNASLGQLNLARSVGRAVGLGFEEGVGKLVPQLLRGFVRIRRTCLELVEMIHSL